MTRAHRRILLCLLAALPAALLITGSGWTQATFQDERTGSLNVAAGSVSAPSNLQAQTDGSTVQLSWSASTSSIGSVTYDVCRSTSPSCPVEDSIGMTTDLELTDSSPPTVDGSYYYGVRAEAGGWLSGLSSVELCIITGSVIDCQ